MHAKNVLERKQKSLKFAIFIAILLALLIHICLLYMIFVVQLSKQENLLINKITQENLAKEKNKPAVSLPEQRAHASSLGLQNQAQVILYQEPIEQLEQIKTLKETPAQKQQHQVFEQVTPLIQVKELEESTVTQKNATLTEIDAPKQINSSEQANSSGESSTVTKKQKSTNPFMPTYGSYRQSERNTQLQNIGQGFLETIERGGNDAMNLNGESREPTVDQIKRISYMQRVMRALQSSFKSDGTFITLAHDEHVISKATIEIDRSGNIVSLTILNPPQNRILDRHIRELIYHACPFAPIPKQLELDKFNFQVTISIKLPTGTHRMQWQCW